MGQFLLTLNKIYILCLVYWNFCIMLLYLMPRYYFFRAEISINWTWKSYCIQNQEKSTHLNKKYAYMSQPFKGDEEWDLFLYHIKWLIISYITWNIFILFENWCHSSQVWQKNAGHIYVCYYHIYVWNLSLCSVKM